MTCDELKEGVRLTSDRPACLGSERVTCKKQSKVVAQLTFGLPLWHRSGIGLEGGLTSGATGYINEQWFRGGLVLEAHRLLYHSA